MWRSERPSGAIRFDGILQRKSDLAFRAETRRHVHCSTFVRISISDSKIFSPRRHEDHEEEYRFDLYQSAKTLTRRHNVMARLDRAIVRPQAYHIREVKVPFRDPCFRPVADRNCVIARWRGEQREANGQSVG